LKALALIMICILSGREINNIWVRYMIKISNLNVSYENKKKYIKVLENIDLTVDMGEICTIIGPSGCGKSTLLKVLSGILKDYSGEALIHGKRIDPKIHRIGFIPQNSGLVSWKTVEENIILSIKIKDGKKNIDIEFYNKLLEELKIKELVKRYPNQLSGGQMQRVSIARALLMKPNLLLMDEPFSALDAMTKEETQELLLNVWKEHSVTTLLVTHDIKEAVYLGKKIAVISRAPGEIVEIIDNSLFGKVDIEIDKEYVLMKNYLKKILKGDKLNET
jgi:ABC-type nitrate/sulfonate/bicarbonate transport system ATPase subunit